MPLGADLPDRSWEWPARCGGITVERTADIDDCRLDLYSIAARSIWRLLRLLPAFVQGAHGSSDSVRTASGTWFRVSTPRPEVVNTDGELLTRTPAEFDVRRAVVTAFAPPAPDR